ncbi:hypothetical protein NDU88_002746 [Pleurodeles waltl]|uniref:Uncharacterized protein n=1 Tax=Pleurodeles waltl TaxID=8319 RepID=A0AAV7M3E0_PLEWA|nr:hypothetical protein NDU88_002746 [Pleurodeles waltl]
MTLRRSVAAARLRAEELEKSQLQNRPEADRAGTVRLAGSALTRRNAVEKRAGPKLRCGKIRERLTQESSPPGWSRAERFRRRTRGSACREGPVFVPVEPEM